MVAAGEAAVLGFTFNVRRALKVIIEQAKEEARVLVSKEEIFRAAEAEADAILTDADAEALRMRRETDDYVDAKLANFEVALHKTIQAVQRGREKIHGRQDYEELAPDDLPG